MRLESRHEPRCINARWAERRDASTHALTGAPADPAAEAAASSRCCNATVTAVTAATKRRKLPVGTTIRFTLSQPDGV